MQLLLIQCDGSKSSLHYWLLVTGSRGIVGIVVFLNTLLATQQKP